ncbi:G-protein coupled receptor GRL101-like [Lineus longissimus]|uniref:G-protein coupled receptor GRL101-like n=1 Tax=Lineus longissimus TaxID=88925 RepID=UPI00315D0DF1
MMHLVLSFRLLLILFGSVTHNDGVLVFKLTSFSLRNQTKYTMAELPTCSMTEYADEANLTKYPKCLGCRYYLSMDLTYNAIAKPEDTCKLSIVNVYLDGCSAAKKTYFEFEIQELYLGKDDCIIIKDMFDKSTLAKCHMHTFHLLSGNGYKEITRTFCGHIKKTTFRGFTNEPQVEFIQKSSPGNTTVFNDVIRIREIPFRQPLVAANPECECPADFIKHRCICYGVFRTKVPSKTWTMAEESCQHKGANLLSIIDQEEMTDIKHFIGSVWMKTLYAYRTQISWIYIGLQDEKMINNFKWSDGNPAVFEEWYHPAYADRLPDLDEAIIKTRPQPSSQPTTRCTVMYVSLDYFWEKTHWCKVPCSYPISDSAYICKKSAERKDVSRVQDNKDDKTTPVATSENGGNFTTATTRITSYPKENPAPPRALLEFQGTSVVNSEAVMTFCGDGWIFYKGKCLAMLTYLGLLSTPVSFILFEWNCRLFNSTIVNATTEAEQQDLRRMLRIINHHNSYGDVLISDGKTKFILGYERDEENQWPILNYYLQRESIYRAKLWIPDTKNVICEQPSWQRRVVCNENQWSCDSGTCISSEYVCDGHPDCLDNSDERNCNADTIPLFRCGDGQTISFSLYCDFIRHCSDGTDETNCIHPPCLEGSFRCENGQCLPMSHYCDFVPQCIDKSDEPENCSLKCTTGFKCYVGKCISKSNSHDIFPDCPGISQEDEQKQVASLFRGSFDLRGKFIPGVATFSSLDPFCLSDEVRCDYADVKCFRRSDACIYDTDELGYMTSCRDGSHLQDCKDADCPGMFKCPNTYCIPVRKRCDGEWDCPYGHDEVGCPITPICPGFLRCRGETFCLDQTEVCDGRVHCKSSRDDEKMCGITPCPQRCVCQGFTLNCHNSSLTSTSLISKQMRVLNISRCRISLTNSSFVGFHYLGWLDVSYNRVSIIEPGTFLDAINLVHLDLGFNNLSAILSDTFNGLGRLETIVLHGNQISMLVSDAFRGLFNLKQLHLDSQDLIDIVPYAFRGMPSLLVLSLSNNSIREISVDAFVGLEKLRSLNLESNQIGIIDPKVFQNLRLDTLETDEFAFCCAANNLGDNGTHAKACTPTPDEFSSCSDLMENAILRIAIWVLGFMALLGNLFVLIWRCIHAKEGGVANCLVANLSVADLLMGIYLLIIGSADVHFRSVYVIYSKQWTNGTVCIIAGMLSFISSEMSVFMLVLITADRVVAIVLAFKVEKLNMKKACVTLVIAWVVIVACGLLPLINKGVLRNFYGSNGVCLPFSFSASDNIYSTLFLAINLLAFFVMAWGYLAIYYVIRKSRKRCEKLGMAGGDSAEVAFLKKMSLVIISDFCCWVPIIILKFLAIGGLKLSGAVSAWTAVFVLPLNSAINPFLYTISAIKESRRRKASRKKSQSKRMTFSQSNMSSSQTITSSTIASQL